MFDETASRQAAVLSCAGMRRAERAAHQADIISLDRMMALAGRAVADVVQQKWTPRPVLVVCGPGNNGGDGFVAATALRKAGWDVRVAALPSGVLSAEAAAAKDAWGADIETLSEHSTRTAELIIDALFGTGLARPLDGLLPALFQEWAARKLPVLAVDIPSGVAGDTGEILGAAPVCAATVTFFRKKRGHVLLPGVALCGEIYVADIGIPDQILNAEDLITLENKKDLWLEHLPLPSATSHKYTRGHALILGGGVMTGAARLAARAAQRMGAGLVTIGAPAEAVSLYAQALESVIVRQADDLTAWQALAEDPQRRSLLIGPGLGRDPAGKAFVLAGLATGKTTVLDADALTLFVENPDELLQALHQECILTPHEGEFLRLFPDLGEGAGDKIARTCLAAKRAGCAVLLKGADTVVAHPEGLAVVNTNAPPWLATGGAGDVLAGMILGLATSGMVPFEAGVAAAWLHGAAARTFGPGLIAEDIVKGLPRQLQQIEKGR